MVNEVMVWMLFKKLGFTLAEIKTILDHNFNPEIILA